VQAARNQSYSDDDVCGAGYSVGFLPYEAECQLSVKGTPAYRHRAWFCSLNEWVVLVGVTDMDGTRASGPLRLLLAKVSRDAPSGI
jgi:hypothetical protein